MNYITVTQLSKRWQVTPRHIQNLCRNGRLSGVIRMGKVWMIPENIERPVDNRNRVIAEEMNCISDKTCWSVVGAAYHISGTAKELVNSLKDMPEAAELTEAQFAYLQGNIPLANRLSDKLFNSSKDFEIKIGAAFLMGICKMYMGDVEGWVRVKTIIEEMPCPNSYLPRKELWLAVYGASIYDMTAYPEWFRRGCFDLLPGGYYPAAMVHYIKYIYIRGDAIVKKQPLDEKTFKGQLFLLPAICEPLISQANLDKAIISEICLRLMCASSYHHTGEDGYAKEHIDRALELALPDCIIAPFAEQRFNLDSLIDKQMKKFDIDMFNKMKTLHSSMMSGWSAIHNKVLNRSHTTALTAKELEAARLAVFGLTNIEIAGRMGISINSVKCYLQAAKDKTGVKKRGELARFV